MDKPEINIIVINGNTAEAMEFTAGGTTVKVNVANSDLEQQQEDFYTNQVDSFFDAMCDLPPKEEEYWMLCAQREKAGAELRDIVGESSIIQDHITWHEGVVSQIERYASHSYYRRGFHEGMRFMAEAIGHKK